MSGGDGRANDALARLLARAGWTPENLGDRLNELSAAQGLGVRGHRRSPRRWLHAEPGRSAPRVPREPWPSLVCHVLHERLGEPVTLEALGWAHRAPLQFVPADHGLQRAVSQIDPTHTRARAGWLCHLATARVLAGRVDQACSTASEAVTLIRRLDSAHAGRRLGYFRAAAEPYARSAAVREFDAKYRSLTDNRSA